MAKMRRLLSKFRHHKNKSKSNGVNDANSSKDGDTIVASGLLPLSRSTENLPPLSTTALSIPSPIIAESIPQNLSPKSFWRDAFRALQEDENNGKLLDAYQKILREESVTGLKDDGTADYLVQTISERLKLVDEQHWKIQVGKANIQVRATLAKVAKTALYAQSFIGSMASGEPHAAMVWAGVSLFLPLLVNASEQPQNLVKGIDYISDILCRFSVSERLYQEQTNAFPLATVTSDIIKLRAKFEKDIIKFYMQVLQYQCRALIQLNHSKSTRVVRDAIKFDSWDQWLTDLQDCEAICTRSMVVLDSEKLNRELHNLDDYMKKLYDMTSAHSLESISLQRETKDTVALMKLGQDIQKSQRRADTEEECVQNFYISSYEKQMNRNPDAVAGTCQWLLENSNFKQWKDSESSSFLWVSAGPGCGKSVLSKMLVNMLSEEDSKLGRPRTVCYFFFKEDDDLQRTPEKALCALIHQILTVPKNSHLIRYAMAAFHKSRHLLRDSFSNLWTVLMRIVADEAAGEVICILDALDECQEKGDRAGRYTLIDALQRFHNNFIEVADARNSHFKVLVTSRPYIDIERRFNILTQRFPTVWLAGDEESDKISKEIDLVIKDEVRKLGNELSLPNSTISALQKNLSEIKHRTYLWMRLMFEVLRQQLTTSERHLLHIIQELPETIDEAYEAILKRIPRQEIRRAKKLLAIVVTATRALSIQEMNIALAVDDYPTQKSSSDLDIEPETALRAILGNICGLFVVVVDSKVYLIHQTARSFLLKNNENQMNEAIRSKYKWKHSIDLADSHLLLSKICVNYLQFDDFEDYSVSDGKIGAATCSLITYASENWAEHVKQTEIDENSSLYTDICKLCDSDYYGCQLWLRSTNSPSLKSVVSEEVSSRHPLHTGAALGINFVVQRALEMTDFSDDHSRKALSIASKLGYIEIIRLILGARKTDNIDDCLFVAIGEKRFESVKVLIEHGAGKKDNYEYALELAAFSGSSDAVKFLISCGADAKRPFKNELSIVMPIIYCSDTSTLTYLIDQGVSPNGLPQDSMTPLSWAISWRNIAMIKALIQHGADVNLSGPDGVCPLSRALQFKLASPAVEKTSDRDIVQVSLKAAKFHDDVIKILIDAGVKLEGLTKPDMNALSAYHARQEWREELGLRIDSNVELDMSLIWPIPSMQIIEV